MIDERRAWQAIEHQFDGQPSCGSDGRSTPADAPAPRRSIDGLGARDISALQEAAAETVLVDLTDTDAVLRAVLAEHSARA